MKKLTLKLSNKTAWLMKYKDSKNSPWIRWISDDEPDVEMIKYLKQNGFRELKIVGEYPLSLIERVNLKTHKILRG